MAAAKPQPIIEGRLSDRNTIKVAFANRLNRILDERQMSQSDLSRAIAKYMPGEKFGRDNVSNWCRGLHLPQGVQLQALAKALRMESKDLLPTRGLPDPTERAPTVAMREAADGMALLQVNTLVPYARALKILALIKAPIDDEAA